MTGRRRCVATVRELRRLDPAILCEALGRFPDFLRDHDLTLPTKATHRNLDYERVQKACMGGEFPPELDDLFFYVRTLGNKDGWEKIRREAESQGKELATGGEGLSCADLAMREWLHNWPSNKELLEQSYARAAILRRTHYVYYPRAAGPKRAFRRPSHAALEDFGKRLGGYFIAERLGRGTRVIMYDFSKEVWFLVRYPGQAERHPAVDDEGGMASHVFRPEEHDAVVYHTVFGYLRLSTNRATEHARYLREFGQLLLGDGEGFDRMAKIVNLEPLKGDCRDIFNCDDVPGLEGIDPVEVAFCALSAPGRKITWEAEDDRTLLDYSHGLNRLLPTDTDTVIEAKFRYRLKNRAWHSLMTVHSGKTLEYERGGDAEVLEEWLRRRRFIKGALGAWNTVVALLVAFIGEWGDAIDGCAEIVADLTG